ncbi:hypothetical protein MRX96_056437 [Rhipicephalus microplus]
MRRKPRRSAPPVVEHRNKSFRALSLSVAITTADRTVFSAMARTQTHAARRKIILALLVRRLRRKRNRSLYIRDIFDKRPEYGEYHHLVQDQLRHSDPEYHFKYFRMTKASFDKLLSLVYHRLVHPPTHRRPISPAERLAVTLRFLATGGSMEDIALSFRMHASTVARILKETLPAIWDCLRPLVLARPSTQRCIENAFGILVSRWRVFLGTVQGAPELLHNMIQAAVCLHNFLMEDTAYCPDEYSDTLCGETVHDGEWRHTVTEIGTKTVPSNNRPTSAAMAMRDEVADYFMSPEGSLPWQLKVVRRC